MPFFEYAQHVRQLGGPRSARAPAGLSGHLFAALGGESGREAGEGADVAAGGYEGEAELEKAAGGGDGSLHLGMIGIAKVPEVGGEVARADF